MLSFSMLFAQTAGASVQGALATADYIILVGYFVLMLFIGFYFYRYMRGIKDYFSGGNSIPWWLSGVSFYMTSFSAFAFIAYSDLAFKYGWVGVTALWVTVPASVFGVTLFAKKWRRARIDSPVEYLETRYSQTLRQLFVWQGVPVKLVDDAFKLIAIAKFIQVCLGADPQKAMLASGLIILAYTFAGGLWAVTVTDFIQFVVLAVAVLVLAPLAIDRAGGWNAFIANSPEGFFHWTNDEYNWIYIVLLSSLYCVSWSSMNWALVQRYYCVKDEREAVKTGWFVTLLNVIGPPLMFLPAMAARQFLGTPETVAGDAVYPQLCVLLLPAGMLGLIVAAMFAATMSTLSGDYNISAGVLTNDVYRRLVRPHASQKELVFVGRLMTVVVGGGALALAMMMAAGTGEDLFVKMVTLFGVVTGPAGIPMIFGLLTKRISNLGALAGWAVGIAAGLAMLSWGPEKMDLQFVVLKSEISIFLVASLATLLVMTVVSLVAPPSAADRERIDAFRNRLSKPIGSLPEDIHDSATTSKIFSPFKIVGICVLAIGLMLLAILPWVTGQLAIELTIGFGLALVIIGGLLAWRSRIEVNGKNP
jgi:SSS family transporter